MNSPNPSGYLERDRSAQVIDVRSEPLPGKGPNDRSFIQRSSDPKLPTIDAAFALRLLRNSWSWALPVAIVGCAIASGVVLSLFKPTYRASFSLLIDPNSSVIYSNSSMQSTPLSLIAFQKFLIKSDKVIDKVIANPVAAQMPMIRNSKDPAAEVRKAINLAGAASNTMIEVTCDASDPIIASSLLNITVDEYLAQKSFIDQFELTARQQVVKAALEKAEAEVELAKNRVRDLSSSAITLDTPVRQGASGVYDSTYVDKLRLERFQLSSEIAAAETALAEAQQTAQLQMSQDSIALLADQEVTSSPAIQALDARIKEIEFRVDKLKASSVGERNPIYQQQISEKAILESKREDMKKQILETSKQRIAGQGVEERKKSVSEFADKVKTLKDRRASLESQIKEFISMMKLTGSGGAELQFAEADLLEWQKTRGQIHDRSVALATERESLEPIRERQRSTPPKLPVESLPLKQLLFANAIGLALPLLIAFGLELRSHRIDSAMSLEKQSEMLVLGEISALPYSADPGSKRAEKALRLYEESIDSLTMSLVLSPNLKQARTLAVTSALAAEGKTTVACQLALSIARSTGKVVLLIDGDMRAPDVHHVFDRKMNSGLAGFLSGENDLSEVIDRDWSSQVHILHAGYLKGSPHRLLSQGAIDRLIEKAKESYDYVIIDTPPILPASESLIYARSVDYCLVCALRDRSRVEQLMQAVNKLEAAGANVAGAVLSGVPFREYSKYYGDYAYGNWDRSQS